ncbi:helix-turn-helix transcriptional regulator [Algoriphagus sp. D3-2-R+10]|uniref:helix-turn-helix domain-containing protein n=1 Tax=Algoriphagus aurantiacus TaxID=3103948 RepID=UPI002B3793B0|nr:helix-turn-helix transcriptional regulator [Algoriphagus sp. D3-2-R+10]MEB2777483.1 helix-turn-helix transcriptional regulator [Algoriphagus sp. D3-2-R+10]
MSYTVIGSFRISHNYAPEHLAAELDIPVEEYIRMENGEQLITTEQAAILAEFYKVDPALFFLKGLSVTNYNHGPNSHSGPITTYNNNYGFKELVEKLMIENDELKKELLKLK